MTEFSVLMREHMAVDGYSSRGLARQANKYGAEFPGWSPLHSDGDGIENWIRLRRLGRGVRPRYWMQLAAVAQVLQLDEDRAQELFSAAGHSLDGIRVSADTEKQRLLYFGQAPLLAGTAIGVAEGNELIPVERSMVPFGDSEMALVPAARLRRSRLVATVGLMAVTTLSGVAMADIGPFKNASVGIPPSEVGNAQAEEGPAAAEQDDRPSPPLPDTPVGLTCVVDLADQPFGDGFIGGNPPSECPSMMIWNQYAGYEGDDLVPWEQGVAQCYAGGALVRMWIGFDLPDGTEGWLPLTPGASGADIFREDRPVEPELRVSPATTAETVGKFDYSELAGSAFAVQLDLPVELDLERAREERGDYFLGACWQESDRAGERGLAFLWPPGVNP